MWTTFRARAVSRWSSRYVVAGHSEQDPQARTAIAACVQREFPGQPAGGDDEGGPAAFEIGPYIGQLHFDGRDRRAAGTEDRRGDRAVAPDQLPSREREAGQPDDPELLVELFGGPGVRREDRPPPRDRSGGPSGGEGEQRLAEGRRVRGQGRARTEGRGGLGPDPFLDVDDRAAPEDAQPGSSVRGLAEVGHRQGRPLVEVRRTFGFPSHLLKV